MLLLITLNKLERQNNINNIFFFQTQQISNDTILFDQFKKQKIFFSYFQVD
jgi:hypothetical protein